MRRAESCYADAVMGSAMVALGPLILLAYIAAIVLVVWQVISALNRIARGVEDIAYTLRSMQSKGPQAS